MKFPNLPITIVSPSRVVCNPFSQPDWACHVNRYVPYLVRGPMLKPSTPHIGKGGGVGRLGSNSRVHKRQTLRNDLLTQRCGTTITSEFHDGTYSAE